MKKFLFLIFLINFFLVFGQSGGSSVYDSSNIIEYKTPSLKSDYSLNCNLENLENIRVSWQGKAFARHRLILSYSNEINNELGLLTTTYIEANIATSGNYLHLGTTGNNIYFLKIDYEDSNIPKEKISLTCQARSFLVPPSNLKVYPVTNNKLHITWKDNVTSTIEYGFLIKRLKLTPNKPYNISISNYNNNEIRINWENSTVLNRENGPFYHNILICKDRNNSNDCKSIDIFNISSAQTSFMATTSYKEGTVIKIKACSFIKLDVNFDNQPDLICSEEAGFNINPTLRNNKFQFLSNILNAFNDFLKNLKEVLTKVKGQEISISDINDYFNNSSIEIKLLNSPFGVYQDDNLINNTVYYYRLEVCEIINEPPNIINQFNNCSLPIYGGAKTTSGTINQKIKLCMQNSMCKEVDGYGKTNELINQCNINYDCVDVGKSKRFYQER